MIIDRQQLEQFSSLELIAKQVVEGFITGLHKSPFHGFSVEFAEHRIYNNGESMKNIDWKLYGRTEKLFIKRFEEETNLRCQIIIDNSSSMHYPDASSDNPLSKIQFSTQASAAIIHLLKKQRDAVGLSIFAEDISLHTRAKSTSVHHKMLYQEMEKMLEDNKAKKQKKTFATDALHSIADNIHKRSLVIIFSDMMDNSSKSDEVFSALQHLRHNKHEVLLFHVIDKKKELDFDFENRPYKFVDLESGDEVKAHPNEVKEAYVKAMKEHKKQLKLKCGQYKIDFIEADINQGVKEILWPYLIKRSKLL